MISRIRNFAQWLLPKSAFARGVSVLVGGTASAQILLILVSPLLTRLYTPEDFGLLAVYTSLLALVSVVSSLRYELAIPLPEDDHEAANVLVLCLFLIIISTVLTGIILIFLGSSIVSILGVPRLSKYLWLFPISVFITGIYTVFNYWGIRTKQFSNIASTKIQQAITVLLIQLTTFKLGVVALLLGQVAGQGIGTTSLLMPALVRKEFKHFNGKDILYLSYRYRKFPFYSTWEGLSNTAGSQLPVILFASLFSPVSAGLYALSHRILSLPMSLIGNAIGQIFFSKAVEARRVGKIDNLVSGLHAQLAHIAMAPALILLLIGPDLFAFIFGEKWRQAGEFARWMTPWLYLVFVSSPLSTLFAVLEQQAQGLAFQLILLISRVIAIIVGAVLVNDLMLTIVLFTSVSALCWLGFLFWISYVAGNSAHSMITPTVSAFGIALMITSPLVLNLALEFPTPHAMVITLTISILLLSARYWQLLRKSY